MVNLFRRRRRPLPQRHTHDKPQMPGAWLFTLRSTPRHFWALKEAIESTGDARVWFGEELSYIKGKGVSLLRVEASGFAWLPALYETWQQIEFREAFNFDIELYVHDRQWVASLRHRTPAEVEQLIRDTAPTNPAPAPA